MDHNEKESLQSLISDGDFCISYDPLSTEIDPESLPFCLPKDIFIVPQDPNIDPFDCASKVKERYGNRAGFILIPGSKFDRFGGRMGRGGGWYDRFLADLPIKWLKIGLTDMKGFSEQRLIQNPWDVRMDWVVVNENGVYNFFIIEQ